MSQHTFTRRETIGIGALGGLTISSLIASTHAFASETGSDAEAAHELDYLVLVNKSNALPDWWEQQLAGHLVTVDNPIAGDTPAQFRLEERTYENYLALREDVLKEGVCIELDSCLRSVAQQQALIDDWTQHSPDPSIPGAEYVAKFVAKPGTSEHHTGLALDVCLVKDDEVIDDNDRMNNDEQAAFDIVHAHLADHGFILRFPQDAQHLTGQAYETWHYRYVGSPEVARFIADNHLTFEEFHGVVEAARDGHTA